MNINGKHYRTIWIYPNNPACVQIIDQRWLPHRFGIEDLRTWEDAARAIRDMHVRGAPLIGSAGAYGIYLALLNFSQKTDWKTHLANAANTLKNTRPTVVNLAYAVDKVSAHLRSETDGMWLLK